MNKKGWGFDTRDMDTSVRPQDDFFHYANGGWLKRHTIPENESAWGSFRILRYETEKKLKKILDDLEKAKNLKLGSPEQMVRDFYRSGMDTKKRAKQEVKPIAKYLKKISDIETREDLLACIAELHMIGIDVVWGCGVDQDMKNGDAYILYLGQAGLGLPDRNYYLNDDAESLRVRNEYRPHIARMFQLLGIKKSEVQDMAETVYRIEHELATYSMRKEDTREVEKIYNKKTLSQFAKIVPWVNWKKYFTRLGASPKTVVVCQPDFFAGVNMSLETISLPEWRTYLTWHLIRGTAGLLSPAFVRENFRFYGTVISGTKEMRPLWRQVLSVVNSGLGELIGKVYVKEYFTPEAKKKALSMVDDVFSAYEAHIQALDWMHTTTKKKALLKLRKMTRKIGYPDRWRSYKGLHIHPDEYVQNVIHLSLFVHRREMRKLTKIVDRKEWHMNPQTVNAYCNQSMNEIVFPAAILQPPFFNLFADDAVNYGSMGTVIGHEMTHNFDDQGAKFDARGNLKNWWTAEDTKRFKKKAKPLSTQFSAYTVADGVPVNGQLTLGENIADLGGLDIALDAYRLVLKKEGRKDIDGFTPEQRFFLSFAVFERELTRPEVEKMLAINDPHSPARHRINGTVTNSSGFYEAFGVKKGDKLYREPKSRIKIW